MGLRCGLRMLWREGCCGWWGRCGRVRFGGVVWLRRVRAIEIMTGAPVPEGLDAVVMVEHVERVTALR